MPAITVDVADRARLDQALIGLLSAAELPGADGDLYVDEEGTPIARHESDGVVPIAEVRWQRPDPAVTTDPVVVAVPGALPSGPLPEAALLLLGAAGVRPDDARHATWAAEWRAAAQLTIEVPVAPEELAARAAELAAAYSSGPVVDVAVRAQPSGSGRTVFLTGLSGSGKSTIARALVDRLAGSRSITLLDGDVVRTHLSRGLGFSREDRDLNIRRIGWVAGEVTKHGGLAVCAPIAPYDATRKWVRAAVEGAGGPGAFLLVWVATPIEECERRDVKGLYAKARAGEITGFTGIDDPYEAPDDAELVIDTTDVPLEDAVDRIVTLLDR